MLPAEKFRILLVEDNEDDLFFFRRVLAKTGIKTPLAVATDGQQAINHIAGALASPTAGEVAPPHLVFLDLKLPLKSGFEVLQWVRSQPSLASTVVVILSSSGERRDVAQAFELGAQGYLVKYPDPTVFTQVIEQVRGLPAQASLGGLSLPGLRKSVL